MLPIYASPVASFAGDIDDSDEAGEEVYDDALLVLPEGDDCASRAMAARRLAKRFWNSARIALSIAVGCCLNLGFDWVGETHIPRSFWLLTAAASSASKGLPPPPPALETLSSTFSNRRSFWGRSVTDAKSNIDLAGAEEGAAAKVGARPNTVLMSSIENC